MSLLLEIKNPRVAAIFEAAVKAAQPFWLCVLSGGKEVHTRFAIYFVLEDDGWYYGEPQQFKCDPCPVPIVVDGAGIAVKKNGPVLVTGGFAQGARMLHTNDTLIIQNVLVHKDSMPKRED